jgi:hypothetical protein
VANTQELTSALESTVDELEGTLPSESLARRRTRGGRNVATMRVVERDGVIVIEDGSRRTRGRTEWTRELELLERDQIGDWLGKLDLKLTPHQGLRRLHGEELVEVSHPTSDGRVLLIVHGTFSNSENILQGIQSGVAGRDFMQWATSRYAQILTYDHPTLATSPLLNAVDLARAFGGFKTDVDVVCHSRGGLVVRWWLDVLDTGDPKSKRACFVGAPLAGTGLASPPRLKGSLSLVSNIARALGPVSAAAPFTVFVAGVFKVVASVTSLAAKTAAIDAAVALVPGLIAQSRVGNNEQLHSLRRAESVYQGRYFGVRSNFESESEGWQFWRYFRDVGTRLRDMAMDTVFESDNDLVVDSASMTELRHDRSLPADQVLDYGTNAVVHHSNYFEQPKTLDFIREKFGTSSDAT